MLISKYFGFLGLGLSVAVALSTAQITTSAQATEPLPNEPVTATQLADHYLLLDTAKAGDRYISVGDRGHILVSDDGGNTWTQTTNVPAAVTLTAVDFADDKTGWVVGHDATIMKTEDGGQTWTKQFEDPYIQAPLLNVLALSGQHAIAVGAYGKMVVTKDGGESWEDRLLFEEDDFHINALVKASDGTIWAAAEAGSLYKSMDNGDTFEPVDSPYEGSFWNGIALDSGRVLLFGMRGNVFYTDDGENWEHSDTGTRQSLSGAIVRNDGTVMIVGNGGVMLSSENQGRTFESLYQPDRVDLTGVAQKPDGSVYLIGAHGITTPSPDATNN